MKRIATLAALLLVAAAATAQRPMTFDDMASIRRIGAPQPSPDGKWIAYAGSNIDLPGNYRKSAIYLMPSTGGASRQISEGVKQDEGPAWSPDGKTIAFASNRTGTGQIFLYDVAAGTTRQLTNVTGGAASVKWLPDGSGVVFTSDVYPDCGVDPACTDRTAAAEKKPSSARVVDNLLYRHWTTWAGQTRTHIVYQPLNGAARDLTPGAFDAPHFSVGGGDEFDVSPDSRELVFARNTDKDAALSTNSDLFLIPLTGGEARRITTRAGADTGPRYSPDGKWIAWRSQARAGAESDQWELWLYNRANGQTTRVASDFPQWIESVTWMPNSRGLYITAPERAKTAVYEVTLDGKFRRLLAEGSAHAVEVSRDGNTIYVLKDSLRRPNDIYSMTRTGANVKRLTTDNDVLLASVSTGETTDMWWTGAENAQVQGHLIKPPGFDASKKYPAIVLIHGGPQGAWGDAWSYRWNPQIFAAQGYVILMPNPRGSSGFGQKFVDEISRDWAGKVYVDIMNGVDAFAALPYVDANRMGAAGASYGGYMVNWILGHTDRFKALVSHAGLFNLMSMYGVTEELWFPEWEFGGNPWDNPELYEKWSPHRFVRNFKTPTLVTHGEIDYRVPVGEGMMLFTALQRRGVPSRLILFPDEGHWILKPQNSRLWYDQVGQWFAKYLK